MVSQNELYDLAMHLKEVSSDFEKIREKLSRKTDDQEMIDAVMKEVKKAHYASKRKSGLTKMGIGLVLMLIGFCITCFNFHSNKSFTFVMYGFTAAGLVLLMWGLYDLVG